MTITPPLRPGERSADADGAAALREASPVRAAAAAALAAAAFLVAVLLVAGGGGVDGEAPAFLREALGPKAAESSLERAPAPGIDITIDDDGYTVERGDSSVSVEAHDIDGEEWERYAHGASRRTRFGTETIVIDGTRTEEFLTVGERQGQRTWRWRLETRLIPRVGRDGRISFLDPTHHRDSDIGLEAVAILDTHGREVTPEGLEWGLVLEGGDWWLTLDLDDSELPLPYVIDPAIDYPSPLYLSSQASAVTGSWRLLTAAPGAVDLTTTTVPCRNCTGFYQWAPGASVSAPGTPSATPTGSGWIVDTAGATGFPAGNWSFTVQTDIPTTTLTPGTAFLAVGVWKGTVAGGTFTSTQNLLLPTSGTTNLRTSTNPVTTTETFALPKFSLAAGERLYVEFWRNQSGAIDTNQAPRRQLDFYVNDGIAAIGHPAADDAAPSHSLSVTELTNPAGQHFDAATATHYYSTAADGSFRVEDAATDSGSGVSRVDFPAVSLPGFTHAAASDTASPYQSNTYAWTAGNTSSPGSQAIVAEDGALNQSSPSPQLSLVRDVTGPGAFSLSTPAAGATVRNGQAVSAAPGDADSGLASVEFRYCPGATCTFAAGTPIGAPDTSAPYAVTWASQPADGTYTLLARATDNVGNTTDSPDRTVTVDNTAPGSVLSVNEGTRADLQHFDSAADTLYYNPAAAGDFTVSDAAADPSGIQSVDFSGLTHTGFTGTATSDSTDPYESSVYAFTAANPTAPLPLPVVVTDGAGNTTSDSLAFVRDVTGPGAFSLSTPAAGATVRNGQAVSAAPGDADSGLASVEFRYCPGATCTFAAGTPIGAPDTSAPYAVTWASQPADGTYTLLARATDNVGNTTDSPARTVTVDNGDPSALFDFPAAAGDYNAAGWDAGCAASGFCGTAGDATSGVAGVEVSIERESTGLYWNGSAFAAAGEIFLAAGLAGPSWSFAFPASSFPGEGDYTVHVRASDAAGNVETGPSRTFAVDTAAPETSIDASPENVTSSTSAGFTFSASEPGSSFECELDGTGFGACSSPESYAALPDGAHTFRVRATDPAGNGDATPASFTWTVDTAAPQTTIDSGPADPTNATAAAFAFSADEGGATFDCELDDGGFGACTSPKSYAGLSGGSHTFRVRAGDAAGNTDATPASFTWTVDAVDPTGSLTAPADGAFLRGTVAVSSDSADAGTGVSSVVFERRPSGSGPWTPIDTDASAPYSVGWDTDALADGGYDLRVLTTDAAGNAFTSGTRSVTIDNTPPDVPTLTLAESSPYAYVSGTEVFVNTAQAGRYEVAASSSDAGSGIDRVGFPLGLEDTDSPYEASYAFADLSGVQTATAFDRAGSGASAGFTVTPDTSPPDAFGLDAPAAGATVANGQAVSASPTDADAGIAAVEVRYCPGSGCSFAAGTPVGSDASAPFSVAWSAQPADGTYTLVARASDRVGNATVSGERTVIVDNSGPSASLDVAEGARPDLQWFDAADGTLYYNPAGAGDFSVTAAASDPAGVQAVDFPAVAETGFTGPARTDATSPYASDVYAFSSANADAPADASVVATDTLANATSLTLAFVRDVAAPAGGSVGYPDGYDADGDVTVTVDAGEDALSGLHPASAALERRTSPLIGGSCDPFAGAWSAVSSPDTVASGACAQYRYRVSDRVGNEVVYGSGNSVKVDLDAPETTIDVSPPDPSVSTAPTFEFSASEAGATFDCELDGSGFSPCTSPTTYAGLAEGTHTFRVRATDPAGNTDPTASVRNWTIDAGPPDTSLDSTPSDPSADDLPSFEFSADEAGATFACEVDGGGFAPCTSPHPVGPLADGGHTFRVRATDSAGNDDPTPAAHAWTVDTTAPDTSFSVVPSDPSGDSAPTFEFAASEAGAGFTCELDGGGFSACASPLAVGPLADGSHTLTVRSTDPAGNTDATPASYTWLVNAGAPTVSLTDPAGVVNAGDADPYTVRATSPDEDVASVEFFRCDDPSPGCAAGSWVSLGADGSAPFEASWPVDPDGNRALRAVVVDTGSNTGEDVADVTIDRTRPTTTIDAQPAHPSASAAAEFQFSAGEAGTTFECELDGSGFSPCTSPKTYGGLADGSHTFRVRATDPAGNAETTPQAVTWMVDTAAPQTAIDVAPADPSASAAPTFEFSGSEAGVTFVCELDGSGFSPCTSPKTYAGLADGAHMFRVRATDPAGNTDATPAVHAWTIDATPPGGGLADPGANLRGTVTLTASPSDAGAGVRDVEFQVSPAGADSWSQVGLDATGPYTAAWDTTSLADGLYDLRVLVIDNAGNATASAEVEDRRVDNTAPSAALDDPGAHLRATVTLTATTHDAGSGIVSIVFQRSPAGGGAWTATPASWDTTAVADGAYDLRVVVLDAAGNATTSTPVTDRRVDNARPSLTGSVPADGATVAFAGSLQLQASEDVAGVANATIDGAPAAGPTVSGSTLTWAGPFGDGPHMLAGELEDLAGNRRPIRVHFTVWSLAAADYPYVEKNSFAGTASSLRAANDAATVTMPAGGWTGGPAGDWLVLRADPAPAAGIPSGFAGAGDMLDVTAYWALAGTSVHEFSKPVEIDLDNTRAHVVPATLEGGSWRPLALVPSGQTLPDGWNDGFYREGADVVVLSRHLSFFALLEDVVAPQVPGGFSGTVSGTTFTLAWRASSDASGVAGYRVYANGALVRALGANALSTVMGAFRTSDTRAFQVAAEDVAGNLSAKSVRLKIVPNLTRVRLAAAKRALVKRGFKAGNVTYRRSAGVPKGAVIRGSASGLRAAGTKIGLTVSSGSGAAARPDSAPAPSTPPSGSSGTPPPPSSGSAPFVPAPVAPAVPAAPATVPEAAAPAAAAPAAALAAAPAESAPAEVRLEPLAEHTPVEPRKLLGLALLVLAFGAAFVAGFRLHRSLRPLPAASNGLEPLVLWDARLLGLATSAVRRLAGRA